MAGPIWLHDRIIEAIHVRQLAEHGGAEGIRDRALLATALAKPLQLHSYGDPPPDLPALAAAHAYGIAHPHPFVDGNKRTSFVAALLFLRVNGQDIRAPKRSATRRGLPSPQATSTKPRSPPGCASGSSRPLDPRRDRLVSPARRRPALDSPRGPSGR